MQPQPQTLAGLNDAAFGSQEDRRAFLRHLRERGFSLQELAEMSMYEIDTVKAWFSKSEGRRRDISGRALALIVSRTGYTIAGYRAAARQAER